MRHAMEVRNAEIRFADAMPGHGLCAGSPVLTPEGEIPVEFLAPGDRIVTRSGTRVLRAVGVAVVTGAEVVRIGTQTLGVETPDADLLVAPLQPVLVRDWRAKALCGASAGVVAAERLADGEYIRRERMAEARVFTLQFNGTAVIYVGGLELGVPAVTVAA
ncbi:MAG: Hint domain-containing protein [Paracoccaceae bacterium]